ncbi:MAG: hypothetical protein AB7I42_22760 [Bradyrhizobium sp.]|uniref:hypothetical protein n=1 Tax=Bradyrhizobium sp. TaxID=376 RepID=UPI003D0FDC11
MTTTTTETQPVAEHIRALMADCIAEARAQGYDGTDKDFEYTAFDMQWITEQVEARVGRKPTEAEWRDAAGFPWTACEYTCDEDGD